MRGESTYLVPSGEGTDLEASGLEFGLGFPFVFRWGHLVLELHCRVSSITIVLLWDMLVLKLDLGVIADDLELVLSGAWALELAFFLALPVEESWLLTFGDLELTESCLDENRVIKLDLRMA